MYIDVYTTHTHIMTVAVFLASNLGGCAQLIAMYKYMADFMLVLFAGLHLFVFWPSTMCWICVCVALCVILHSLAAFLICIVLIGESHPMWNAPCLRCSLVAVRALRLFSFVALCSARSVVQLWRWMSHGTMCLAGGSWSNKKTYIISNCMDV